MKSFRILVKLSIITMFFQCNYMKEKIVENIPGYEYKKAEIDKFYYVNMEGGNTPVIPLIKPYNFQKVGSKITWSIYTDKLDNKLGDVIDPTQYFNIKFPHIYGYKSFEKDEKDSDFDSPEKWFIIDTQSKKIVFFEKETEFKVALKSLNLPEKFLNPDEVYEEFKQDPVLEWFPEDIKKQLNKVNSSLKAK